MGCNGDDEKSKIEQLLDEAAAVDMQASDAFGLARQLDRQIHQKTREAERAEEAAGAAAAASGGEGGGRRRHGGSGDNLSKQGAIRCPTATQRREAQRAIA